jgi:hypothetical protein
MRTSLRAHVQEVARVKIALMLPDLNVPLHLRREDQKGQQIDQKNHHVRKGNQAAEIPLGRHDIQQNHLEPSAQRARKAKNHATSANRGVGRRKGIVPDLLETSVQPGQMRTGHGIFVNREVESRKGIVLDPLEANVQLARKGKGDVTSVSLDQLIRVETVTNLLEANDLLVMKEANDESSASPVMNRAVPDPEEGIVVLEMASRQGAQIAPGQESLIAIVWTVQRLVKKKKRLPPDDLITENSPTIGVRLRSLTAAV